MPYDTATPLQVDKDRAAFQFTGTGGVLPVPREMPIGVNPGNWVFGVLAELNARDTTSRSQPVVVGTPIVPINPVSAAQATKNAYMVAQHKMEALFRAGQAGNTAAATAAAGMAAAQISGFLATHFD